MAEIVKHRVNLKDPSTFRKGKIDHEKVDSTTEEEIARQAENDMHEASMLMAKYVCSVRTKLQLGRLEFARRIDVSPETVRNWEQGKRHPTGSARALLRVLDKEPRTALGVLTGTVDTPCE